MKILIKGGRVIDPASARDEVADVLIASGRIVSIGRVNESSADRVIDATGLVVAPGLVDLAARLREPGQEHEGMLESELAADPAKADDAPGRDRDIADLVPARRRIDQPPVLDQNPHATFPAMIDITAMRTAMPKVTCGRITLCVPSATSESISTPRLIGPGCITIASGLASASFSGVRP